MIQLATVINTTVLTTVHAVNTVEELVRNITGPTITTFLDNVSYIAHVSIVNMT